jgi:adenine-specific DNA-methyltransferase
MKTMDKLKMHTPDLTQDHIAKLRALFPGCVTEAKGDDGRVRLAVDFDLLRQELSGSLVEGPQERYQLNWPGKREALLTANAPIAKTLRPCREESMDFDTTKNLFIEGDNLDALKLLQETYLGKVKMIYIDPPYNTGSDLIYDDDFSSPRSQFLSESGQYDPTGRRLVANLNSNGRFHSDWLTMLYPRIKLARNLLKEDGVFFASIDDNEVENLRKVCDEIFGAPNFLGCFVIKSTPNARNYGHIAKMHEYCLMYGKESDLTATREEIVEGKDFKYTDIQGGFNIHPLYNSDESFHFKNRPNLYYPFYLSADSEDEDGFFRIGVEKSSLYDIEVFPPKSAKNSVQFVWRWGKEKAAMDVNKEIVGYRTEQGEYRIVRKMRHTTQIVRSMMLDKVYSGRRGTAEVEELFGKKVFSFPKPLALLEKLIEISTEADEIVLDLFAGSGTTAHAVLNQNSRDSGNRRFILIQAPEECAKKTEYEGGGFEKISEICRHRIILAGKTIGAENGAIDWVMDSGFRAFKIDSSNLADVHYTPDAVTQSALDGFTDNVKPDRTPEDLLFQVMLDWGVDLALPITRLTIQSREVLFVDKADSNALAACFDATGRIDETFVKELATHKPLRAVFRDAGFADSAAKINVDQIFKLLSPGTEVKCI